MATRGRSTAGSGPATRRCSRRISTSAPGQLTGRPRALAVGLARAVPVGRRRRASSRPTRSRARARAAATRPSDRALARELLSSAKDRAENVMIVDVLRNDLGRVCRPGSVRVPRLCRLERTAAVQHLVSTVTGVLAAGPRRVRPARRRRSRAARSPARPKIRAMEILEGLEPVRRGPYTGAIGWIGPDGAMQTSIVIRTFVADGQRLTPPRRWRDHLAERPGGRVGRDRRQGARTAAARSAGSRRHERRPRVAPGTSGSTAGSWPPDGPHLSVFDRGFQLGDGVFETLRVRGAPSDRARRAPRPAPPLRAPASTSRCPTTSTRTLAAGIAALLAADGLDGDRPAMPRSGSRSRAARSAVGACCPPAEVVAPTIAIQAWPVVPPPADHLERGLHLVASAVRRDPANPLVALKTTSRADYVYARLEARRAGADDALFLTLDGHLSEGTTANIFLVRRRRELATPSLDVRDPARARPGRGCSRGARGSACGRSRGASRRDDLADADEAFLSSASPGILPVTAVRRARRSATGGPGRGRVRARDGSRGDDRWPRERRRRDPRRADRRDPRSSSTEGDRLAGQPVAGVAPGLAPALGRPARHGVGEHGSLPPRLADGRQARRASSAAGR